MKKNKKLKEGERENLKHSKQGGVHICVHDCFIYLCNALILKLL